MLRTAICCLGSSCIISRTLAYAATKIALPSKKLEHPLERYTSSTLVLALSRKRRAAAMSPANECAHLYPDPQKMRHGAALHSVRATLPASCRVNKKLRCDAATWAVKAQRARVAQCVWMA